MLLRCKACNNLFSEEEMYEKTKEWYRKDNFNVEVRNIMIKEDKLIIPHLYLCPKCGSFLNNVSLVKGNGT